MSVEFKTLENGITIINDKMMLKVHLLEFG